MKPDMMKMTIEDRPATNDEIRRAISASHESLMEGCRLNDNYCEMDSDLGGVIRYPAEEFEFFALLSDADENTVN